MKSNFFSKSSILKNFLVFNLIVFLVLSIFTFLYLNAIKPNLIKNRSNEHIKIINNTSDHISRLNIKFNKESATQFLLSTRFLFQNLDRVQLYDLNSNLLADTDTLDLVKNAFIRSENVQETSIDKSNDMIDLSEDLKKNKTSSFNTESYVTDYSKKKNINEKLIISETINNNFYVMTINSVLINNEKK
jgi:two-component system sensor histidine kinase ChvG